MNLVNSVEYICKSKPKQIIITWTGLTKRKSTYSQQYTCMSRNILSVPHLCHQHFPNQSTREFILFSTAVWFEKTFKHRYIQDNRIYFLFIQPKFQDLFYTVLCWLTHDKHILTTPTLNFSSISAKRITDHIQTSNRRMKKNVLSIGIFIVSI